MIHTCIQVYISFLELIVDFSLSASEYSACFSSKGKQSLFLLLKRSHPYSVGFSHLESVWCHASRSDSDYTSLASCPFLEQPMGKDPTVMRPFIGMVT